MRKIILPLAVTALLVTSCVEPIVMDPLEEMPVVVNCVLTRDGQMPEIYSGMTFTTPEQKLYLYYAKSPSGSDYVVIKDAEVTVSERRFKHKFSWNGECWTSSFLPEFDTQYTLDVTLPDGRTLSGTTTYPEALTISSHPLYTYPGMVTSLARWQRITRYDWISGPKRDAFLWAIPTPKCEMPYLVTDHSGADNANVVGGSWKDLPVSMQCDSSITKIRNTLHRDEWDYGIWDAFVRRCNTLPVHRGYLRICHPSDYDNGNENAKTQITGSRRTDTGEVGVVTDSWSDAFILFGDRFINLTPPGMYGLAVFGMLYKTYFLSEEYDAYLNSILHMQLRGDELAASYFSPDANYTNINGGIGVFGAIY